ncbi:type II toxin-antitoxin system VapB family antitoxin [Nonomuraea helvata]|uniref:Type II toxin-antitoxin system VapB family antitoxin n=1 Tax=Nonomuraea helvata TaxID=37484 RepID=A0ABV5SFD0_9ACTN
MTRTVIDLDDEALAEAAELLGTSSKEETVNAALREIVDRRRRAAAVARMRQMVAEGEIDLSLLDKAACPKVMAPPGGTGEPWLTCPT